MAFRNPFRPSTIAKHIEAFARQRDWVALGLVLIVFLVSFVGVWLGIRRSPPQHTASEELTRQLDEVDRVKGSLEHLSAFIAAEEARLRDYESTISALADERTKLEHLNAAGRKTVEDILAYSEKRAQRNKWRDIGVGFIFGLLSSYTASVFFELSRSWMSKR